MQPLFQALERQGWSVFWDHRTIDIGDHWSKRINHAIRTSKCVVVVWSKASVDSEWVLEEANVAKQRNVLLPIQIDAVDIPVGFTMRQTGDFIRWNADVNDPQFIRLAEKVRELVAQHDAEQAQREAADTAERERLAKEKAATAQKAREAAEHQRWLEEPQARLAAEEAAKQKRLAQEHAAEQKARDAAEQQAKARADQLKREQAAAEEKARKESIRQTKINQDPLDKKFPLVPALLMSTAVLGGGGYYYVHNHESFSVGASPAGDFSVQQTDPVKKESLAGQAPTVAPQTATKTSSVVLAQKIFEPEMVSIPAGTFTMGCDPKRDDVEGGCTDDEKPAHKVTLNAFKMAKTETTVAQFRAFVEATSYKTTAETQGSCGGDKTGKGDWGYVDGNHWKKTGFAQTENDPVTCVSWDDAQAYLQWLNAETGKAYRLPTEAEWEYAARGGKQGAYPWGQKGADGCGHANMADRKAKEKYPDWTVADCNDGYIYTAPVGSFAANGYGLHDMHGNVWEWCQDWYDGGYYASSPASNPEGAASGTTRVLRGGSWYDDAQYVRSAYRNRSTPDFRSGITGFRLVLP